MEVFSRVFGAAFEGFTPAAPRAPAPVERLTRVDPISLYYELVARSRFIKSSGPRSSTGMGVIRKARFPISHAHVLMFLGRRAEGAFTPFTTEEKDLLWDKLNTLCTREVFDELVNLSWSS
jgi:hypothetical protein